MVSQVAAQNLTPQLHILHVDPSVKDQNQLREQLLTANATWRVTSVSDRDALIRILGRDTFDLVISDIDMSSLPGMTVIEQIKHTVRSNLPIVIFTAQDSAAQAVAALRAGALDYVVKSAANWENISTKISDWLALNQAQLAEQERLTVMAESEARYRYVSELSTDVVYSLAVSDEGTLQLVWLVGPLEELTGYQQTELVHGNDWQKLIHAEDRAELLGSLENLRAGKTADLTFRIITRNGEIRWVRVFNRPVMDERGALVRVWGALQNISTEKQVLLDWEHQRLLNHTLANLMAAFNTNLSRNALLSRLLEALQTLLPFDLAEVVIKNTHDDLQIVASQTTQPLEDYQSEQWLTNNLHIRRLLRTKKPLLIADTATERAWLDEPEGLIRSWVGIPLVVGNQTIGFLSLKHQNPNTFTTAHLNLLRIFADFAAAALENNRLFLNARQLQQKTQIQSRWLDTLSNVISEGIVLLTDDQEVSLANPVAMKYLSVLSDWKVGDRVDHLAGHPIHDFLRPNTSEDTFEVELKHPETRIFEIASQRVFSDSDMADYWLLILRDVTRRHNTQHHLRSQERLAAVGQLASGIAHDFNNLLTIITGYSDLLIRRNKDDKIVKPVQEIMKAALRGSVLTDQLLTFARRQILKYKRVDFNLLLENVSDILHEALDPEIEMAFDLAPDLWQVKADPVQLEHVIVNLALNANDAMQAQGLLTIQTENRAITQPQQLSHALLRPGNYVVISVTDNGVGMDEETVAHIFEPFFTTKELGQGTGLSLATVHGIIRQSGGVIHVLSNPKRGSTFTIYLPRLDDEPLPDPQTNFEKMLTSKGTILVVDDEFALRMFMERTLTKAGYQVIGGNNGLDALLAYQQHNNPVDLVIADMIMPQMSGRELVRRLHGLQPTFNTLFISAYVSEQLIQLDTLDPDTHFLEKPFNADLLLDTVAQILKPTNSNQA